MDIPVIDWFEEPIKSSIKSVFNGLNSNLEALDVFKKYRVTHFELLKQQVSHVKILGMQQPMNLNDLYFPATVSTNIRRRIYDPEWKSIDAKERKRKVSIVKATDDGDSYIDKNARVIILGGPGAGKTTFLKFMALAYSDRSVFEKTNLKTSYLPIYINIPLMAKDDEEVIDAICVPLENRGLEYSRDFYFRLLENGSCILLLDSLDEVPVEYKDLTIKKIKKFSKLYPKLRIVISCRTADYEQVFDDFCEVELARLSQEGVKSIVKAWFGKDHQKSTKLLALLNNDETVSSLTETPLLLSLLCIQFKNDLALPKRKTELYRRCVDVLIRDWDTTRGFRRDTSYSQLSDDNKEKIFEVIAGCACSESFDYELDESFVLQKISNEIIRFSINPGDAKGILHEIENHHGILEKCSVDTYQFSHGTMQEYFAARYFVAKRQEIDVLKKNYENEGWHNIIVFISSIMDDPECYLKFLIAKSSMEKFQNYPAFGKRLAYLWLLYRCMAMGVSIMPDFRIQICKHLVKSQVDMLVQLNKDGVLPYAAKTQNGVRQAIYYYRKSRDSLKKILKPYRSLMNEIVISPVKEYSDEVISFSSQITDNFIPDLYARAGIMSCLLVPISDAKPQNFIDIMLNYSELLSKRKALNLQSVYSESIKLHLEEHKELN